METANVYFNALEEVKNRPNRRSRSVMIVRKYMN